MSCIPTAGFCFPFEDIIASELTSTQLKPVSKLIRVESSMFSPRNGQSKNFHGKRYGRTWWLNAFHIPTLVHFLRIPLLVTNVYRNPSNMGAFQWHVSWSIFTHPTSSMMFNVSTRNHLVSLPLFIKRNLSPKHLEIMFFFAGQSSPSVANPRAPEEEGHGEKEVEEPRHPPGRWFVACGEKSPPPIELHRGT